MIRTNDIEKRAQVVDKQLIERGEMYIDRTLAEKWQPGQSVEIGLSEDYTSRTANALAAMYRENGWNVTVSADTKEGGFVLSFRRTSEQTYP